MSSSLCAVIDPFMHVCACVCRKQDDLVHGGMYTSATLQNAD